MPELVEHANRVEILSPMRGGSRIVFALMALFPLIAPYELLLRVEWQDYFHPFFLLAALVSAGAVALSGFLLFAAVAGLSSRMIFDRKRQAFTYTAEAPLVRRRTSKCPLSAVECVDIGIREWSDSAPTYHLRVVMVNGLQFESASTSSRTEVEAIKSHVDAFLKHALT